MQFRKFLTYSLASVCVLSSIPFLPAQAVTMEQLATNAESIDVYFSDDGSDLTTLNKENITATLDGNPLTVEDFALSEQRINYTFLLDISGSVPEEYMTAAKEQIMAIYANLEEADLLSVITFGDEVHTIIDGTETLAEVQTILDGVHCDNDYTHFYDAVDLLLSRLEGTSDMRNIAVVVSDGINTGDVNTSVATLRSRLSGSGVAIYALAVDAASYWAIYSFREFVQLSGGQLFEYSPETCAEAMTNLTDSVDKIWNVGIQVDPALITGEAQSLVVQIGDYGTIEQEVILEQRSVDTTAPTITSWELVPETGTLTLHFSEAMADLKNPEHYLITAPNGNLAPVTVVEYTDDSVVLNIEGFDNATGWCAEFYRLMDASANRNLLEAEPIILTPEVEVVPEIPEEPVSEEFNFGAFIFEYWQYILGAGLLLLVIIFYIVLKPSRKKNEDEATEGADGSAEEGSGVHVSKSSEQLADDSFGEKTDDKLSKHDKIMARSKKRAKKRAELILRRKEKKEQKEASAAEDQSRSNAPKVKRFRLLWLREDAPEAETESAAQTDETLAAEQAEYNENYGGVMMSKGSAPLGAAPVREAANAGSAGSSAESGDNDVHVNEHKRERRGLFGLFRFRKSESEDVMSDDDLGVAVNEPLRGITAPTRKDGTLAEDSAEYEVDKVSQHRKAPKIKRARKGWFTWRKKDIPEVPETEEAAETAEEGTDKTPLTAEEAAVLAAETGEEVSEKTARKYIKTKKKRFWQRKKKEEAAETEAAEDVAVAEDDSSAEVAAETEEDLIDKKTARKYIKPSRNWFKKKMEPMINQDVPERAAEEAASETASVADVVADAAEAVGVVAGATAETAVTESSGNDGAETTPKKPQIQGGSIKSGGFALTGISSNYRSSIFTVSLGETKLKNVNFAKSGAKKNAAKEEKQTSAAEQTSNTASFGSSVRSSSYNSSKKVSFTFGDKKKK